MSRNGRARKTDELPGYLAESMPKKETEEHRQMRAFYLNLPEAERHIRRVAEKFNCSYQKVYLAARAFDWSGDVQKREATIQDPFYEEHKKLVDGFRTKALMLACKHLENELIRAGVPGPALPETVIEKIKSGELSGAGQELLDFVKLLPIKAKDYKDLNNLIDMIRKIVFEWNPNESLGEGGILGKGKNISFNQFSLIIEKPTE